MFRRGVILLFGLCALAACGQPQGHLPSPRAVLKTGKPTPAPTSPFEPALREQGEAVVLAQERYAFANGGYFDSDMECLVVPARCIPDHDGQRDSFLEAGRAKLEPVHRYVQTLHTSRGLDSTVTARARVSPTSVENIAYTAVPARTGIRGLRALCLDLDWVCYARDGILPPVVDGRCPRPMRGDMYNCIGITQPASSLSELRQMRRERAQTDTEGVQP
jgi:hypothetical protein